MLALYALTIFLLVCLFLYLAFPGRWSLFTVSIACLTVVVFLVQTGLFLCAVLMLS